MSALRTSLGSLAFAARHCGDMSLEDRCVPIGRLLRSAYIDLEQAWDIIVAILRADRRGALAVELEEVTTVVLQEMLCQADERGLGRIAADLDGIAMAGKGWHSECAAWVEEAMAPEVVFEACQSAVALFPERVEALPRVLARYVEDGRGPYADLLHRAQPLACRRLLVAVLFELGATHRDWTRWLEFLPAAMRAATSGVMADVLWSLSSDSGFTMGTALPAPPETVVAGWNTPEFAVRTA